MIRAIEQRGKEVAAAAFASFGANDAPAIGEAFLAVSPDGGLMYPTDVERGDDRIAFRVKRCPLKDAWVEAGVGDEKHALPHRRRLRPRSVRGDRRALPQRHLDARPRLRLLPHRADRSRCRLSIDDLRCVEIQVRPSVCRPAEHQHSLAPDHQLDDLVMVGLGDLALAGLDAAPQHDDTVRHSKDVLQIVRDEDHAAPLRLELVD